MSGGMIRRARLLCGAAALAMSVSMAAQATAAEESVRFNIAPQPLTTALNEFGLQSQRQVLFTTDLTGAKLSRGVNLEGDPEAILAEMLNGTGLTFRKNGDTFLIVQEGGSGPQARSAGDVDALIVTAQKREENIQDVPIAISAFSQEALEAQKIEGGFDLLKAIPNVTFSKNNFTSYNFSIRGIGTKAVSATTDPGVAVAFNNTALLQNRLFEQEYFDVERVEVLRGPQGTLYGRNATAGVINVISAKPDLNDFEGMFKLEVGNYDSKRASGMLNIPIIEDKLAVRFAGALTNRSGYDYNSITQKAVNGRELWSARMTVGFEPVEQLRANLIWEHFEEDDNRSRTGKQLCHRDEARTMIGSTPVASNWQGEEIGILRSSMFSQGCKAGSLYDDNAFGTPNGLALPFVWSTLALQKGGQFPLGHLPGPGFVNASLLEMKDPYDNMMQSRDLRTIASYRDPVYRGKADIVELNIDFDLTDELTLTSQTAYNKDTVYSFQDFNRFNTQPVFQDTSIFRMEWDQSSVSPYANLAPRPAGSPPGTNGVFCDPQLGCSDTIAGFDISQGQAKQFSQEIRLQSSFDGPLNFSAGVNYTKFDVLVDYYIFFNLLTASALVLPFNGQIGNPTSDINVCGIGGYGFQLSGPFAMDDPMAICPYIDPNPIETLDGEGHNYFRSKNPYNLKSGAAFGELYWEISDTLKLTAGLRYTDDRKNFTPVPSQMLLARSLMAGGTVNRGYPEDPPIKMQWQEWTGRLGFDWKPDLGFTDETMVYAFYSRGYKGGGANPPRPGFASEAEGIEQALSMGIPPSMVEDWRLAGAFPTLTLHAAEYESTFLPEFVNAFEIGAKNTLLDGALTLNLGAFYYDYTDYQVSQIRDRTAINENFDATVWGLELEGRFAPSRDLQFIANIGYLDTEIADGETSIDIMNRTAGEPGWTVVKPWLQYPSNCIAPIGVAENWLQEHAAFQYYWTLCGGVGGLLGMMSWFELPTDPTTNQPYTPLYYDGTNGRLDINGGAGIAQDLGGNELPNSPHWTVNLGTQYGFDWIDGWRATVRGDAYWQSQSWHRVYNSDPYDKLHGWYNVNLALWLEHEESGIKVEVYAKNLLDKTPITDAFLNSDDTALTTNVFVLDPRLVGVSIRKEF